MDRRSWLWRRKSSEKSPGETESSGSSLSERYSDDQDGLRTSPNHAQSTEVTSNITNDEVHETVKNLSEKLSAALLNISAKEDLVKQHAKVAEEAVSGWEKAENEVAALKQQLEAATQKNIAFEDRVSHLDGALKECVRQLRLSREEQEQKTQESLKKKMSEWESEKLELESKLSEVQTQLELAKAEASSASGLGSKLEAMERENLALKTELLTRSEELKIRTLEIDLSTRAAETASKQHLESIKKVAKLESECRRLKAVARRTSLSSANEYKPSVASSFYVDSLTDSQSDSGERLLSVDNDIRKMGGSEINDADPSGSDSWASALIAELDQFKNEKSIGRTVTASSMDINLMDDFLEMEKLAAMPEISTVNQTPGRVDPVNRNTLSQDESEALLHRTAELEEKIERVEAEKVVLEMALCDTRDQLGLAQVKLLKAEEKSGELWRKLASVDESKHATEVAMEAMNAVRKALESRVEAADAEARELHAKVTCLVAEIEGERASSAELAAKCQKLEVADAEASELHSKVASLGAEVERERASSAELAVKCKKLEDELSRRKHEAELRWSRISNGELKMKQDKELAMAAGKLVDCQKTIASLGQQLKSLATIEDFMPGDDKPELEQRTLLSSGAYKFSSALHNGSTVESLPSSLSSGLANPFSWSRIHNHIENQ
ncbi:hypothetical protein QJS04_geneDACA017264 [Acorus gramineus]|uniref:Filament-like plant protein n=1 Tax=Acorus gramineus TaxID=55184 RepID=A0AAV9A2X6_ACOGR|nr:hypothetical protein QJS04_geneDACA017264 [Acorus gramineus]